MAKKSAIARNHKRIKLAEKYASERKELKQLLSSPETSDERFFDAQKRLSKLPRDSSPVRIKKRCSITGRPRAYMNRFGLSRITFRELALAGKIPGVTKASW